jgi:hypothetical protein
VPEHVFVETNFVVDWAAPAHLRVPDAVALVERAERGEIALHIPAICLLEARPVLRSERFQPRRDARPIRSFLHDAGEARGFGEADRGVVFRALDAYEAYMREALAEVPQRIDSLRVRPGIDVFSADDGILERCLDLTSRADGAVRPFDLAVLGSVLVRAERIRASGDGCPLAFCERDTDLQPWDRDGNPRRWLRDLFDAAAVWVFEDFAMTNPARPPGWPDAA